MIGEVISHYLIKEKIGEGGMGVVFKAEDIKLKRTVALKFISPNRFEDHESQARFINEAQAVASLNHPNIGTIYEIEDAGDQTFIAMEYVEGNNLRDLLREGPFEMEKSLFITRQILRGLQEAHNKGIVHRDIKSSNILVTPKNQAKIMDFGIAKTLGGTQITRKPTILGTVDYMSPEQASGDQVDNRSDLWSLGVLFYEMLTGQLPFRGDNDQTVLYSILNKEPKTMNLADAGIPAELEKIIVDLDLLFEGNKWKRRILAIKRSRVFSRILAFVRRKPILTGVVFLLLISVLAALPLFDKLIVEMGLRSLPEKIVLGVLPCEIDGGDEDLKTRCLGLTEYLSGKLTQLESFRDELQVIPSSDIRALDIKTPRAAWKELRIKMVVTGRIIRKKEKVELYLTLSRTKPLQQLRAEKIEVQIDEMDRIFEESLRAIATMLAININPEAERALKEGESKNPDAVMYYSTGLGFLSQKDPSSLDKAIKKFHSAIEKDSLYAMAHVQLGESFWEKYNRTKESLWVENALFHCRNALNLNQDLVPALMAMGSILTGTGEYEEALEYLNRAIELEPENARARRDLGLAFEELGRYDEAESEYKQAIRYKQDYWRGYRNLGYLYFSQGEYKEAERYFQRLTELKPEDALGYILLGAVLYRLEKVDDALEAFKKAQKLDPEDPVSYTNQGTIYYFEKKDYKKARKIYEKAAKLKEVAYYVFGNLADSCRHMGDGKKAMEYYRKALSLAEKRLMVNSKNVKILSYMARYHAWVGEKTEAIKKIEKAMTLAPDNVEILLISVKVNEICDRRKIALDSLKKLLDLGGTLSEIEKNPDLEELRKDPEYIKITSQRSLGRKTNFSGEVITT